MYYVSALERSDIELLDFERERSSKQEKAFFSFWKKFLSLQGAQDSQRLD